jgi:hypothetical protein
MLSTATVATDWIVAASSCIAAGAAVAPLAASAYKKNRAES